MLPFGSQTRSPPALYRPQPLLFGHVPVLATDKEWTAGHQPSLSSSAFQSLLKLVSVKAMTPSNHLVLCRPLLLLPSVFPSIRVFSSESAFHIRGPEDWSFSISPSNEHSGLISFRMDWLDLLAVQGTLKSLLQHHSSKASVLRCLLYGLPRPWQLLISCPFPHFIISRLLYKWNCTVGNQLGSAFFAQHNHLMSHSTCCIDGEWVPFDGGVWFHSMEPFPR